MLRSLTESDRGLLAWVREATDGAPATLLASVASTAGREGVCICLFDVVLSQRPPLVAARKPSLRADACYLVWVEDESVESAHDLHWKLVIGAAGADERAGWKVDRTPLDASFWSSLGATRRPALVLRVPVEHEWEQPVIPIVRELPDVEPVPARPLRGRVLGPGDVPISRARVEIASLRSRCTTDAQGRFRFESVPTGPHRPTSLVVRAKGRSQEVPIPSTSVDDSLIVSFQVPEA